MTTAAMALVSREPAWTAESAGERSGTLLVVGEPEHAGFDPRRLRRLFNTRSATSSGERANLMSHFLLTEVVDKILDSLSLDRLLVRLIDLATATIEAERGTLFLHDAETGELFSRIAQGDGVAEIRMPSTKGVAGAAFTSGQPVIVNDAYASPAFSPDIDLLSGYRTRSLICVPLCNRRGAIIGVTELLNKRSGRFDDADVAILAAITAQAAATLENAHLVERLQRDRRLDAELLVINESISEELEIESLLAKIVAATSRLLEAERSTLFVYDPVTGELWSRIAEGVGSLEIRMPASSGIAGATFVGGQAIAVDDAYADPRFNYEIDRQTGFRTRNVLSMPVFDRAGQPIGVVQALNKSAGFDDRDARRLGAFAKQIAIALHNAQLFSDVLTLKNHNENVLRSLSNGVITLDRSLNIIKVNEAARRILRLPPGRLLSGSARDVFGKASAALARSIDFLAEMQRPDYLADLDLRLEDGGTTSVNITCAPLLDSRGAGMGYMLVLEDISREKQVRNTMSRYMAREVVDKLLASDDDVMHGTSQVATVLFSDIRRFTALTEAQTAHETVAMLNEYFTEMVDVVFRHHGILDKYIGDAIMAVFGAPARDGVDADRAVTVAIEMIEALRRFNDRRRAQKLAPIEIGIGLSTGEVLAGSVGSAKRMDYTVIGDTVNLAARIEGANKHYCTSILLSETTRASLRSVRLVRPVDLIRVRGKSEAVEIFEVLDHHTPESFPNMCQALAAYEAGFNRYRRRDWSGALQRFSEAVELAPADGPSWIYADRCLFYRQHPPGDDWDGVWTMPES
jgi:adenylate cyclase